MNQSKFKKNITAATLPTALRLTQLSDSKLIIVQANMSKKYSNLKCKIKYGEMQFESNTINKSTDNPKWNYRTPKLEKLRESQFMIVTI